LRSIVLSAALAAMPVHAADVTYEWFEYAGRDATYSAPLPAGHFHNPILAGYYPDPSVARAGDKYYLVNSTFAHWPGIPIHESTDLVHWTLIGHALNDPTKVNYDGLGISRGVFAPSIHFHEDTWYVINTLVDAGGNFFVTAKDPRGPWSDPHWLNEIDGIDPSFFFDAGGKAYIVNNGPPQDPPLYEGHRAIWIQEFDGAANKLVGPRKVIVNGGADISKKPIWIEGPHLYRIKDWYYLMCAEGGTERGHSEVIFRAKSPWGPFEPYKGNPILTQRDLPEDRANPVTNTGHADLVQMQDGSWWAVFLGSRPYDGFRYNTGRETFLLPVSWKDGWPVILEQGKPVPYTLKGPRSMKKDAGSSDSLAGNFTQRDEFDMAEPGHEWLQVHVPKEKWYHLMDGTLVIHPLPVKLSEKRNASFYARRQAHIRFAASTELAPPRAPGTAAGLAAYQSESHWYFFGARQAEGKLQLFLERQAGGAVQTVKTLAINAPEKLRLLINGNAGRYSFFYDAGDGWFVLHDNDDATILSTEVAGGFVGTVLGPYARQE